MKSVELPCDIGDKVYVIEVDWCPCDICPHGKEMKYSSGLCFSSEKEYDCPPQRYSVVDKDCEAFLIDKDGVSKPGYMEDYEGFCQYTGCDNKVYYSKTKARLIAKRYQKEQNHTII